MRAQPDRASRARRRIAGGGLAALSAITGVISYIDGLDVVRWVGIAGRVAYLVPLVPDLMIVTSSMTLLDAARARVRRPFLAMLSLAAGIGWTVAMNVSAGWRHGLGGALILGAVPVAFVLTFETLIGLVRRGRGGESQALVPAAPGQPQPAEPPSTEEALALLVASDSQRKLAEALGVPRSRVETWAASVAVVAQAGVNGSGPDE